MNDYIKREDALAYISAKTIDCNPDHFAMDTFEGYGQWMHNSGWNGGIIASRCAVKDAPAADVVERKRGEWYGEYDGYADGSPVYDIWSCSCCGKYFHEWEEKPDWNFCPNCGARMEES